MRSSESEQMAEDCFKKLILWAVNKYDLKKLKCLENIVLVKSKQDSSLKYLLCYDVYYNAFYKLMCIVNLLGELCRYNI